MENDYLWDKTGEDKEIEQLENALKQFRYLPIAPPVLPVKIEEKSEFSFFPKMFRFALAGFACLAIVFVGLGIWLGVSNDKIEDIADLSQPIVEPVEITIEPTVEPINPEITSTPEIVRAVEKKPIQPKYVAVSKPTKIVFRQNPPKIKANKPVIELTAEEKFAYDQLMLALSITGAKLKEVKDKANSIEDSTAIKTLK